MMHMTKLWIGPAAGFIIGFCIPDDEIGLRILAGFLLALVGLFAQFIIQYAVLSVIKRNMSFLKSEEKFIYTILSLAAKILSADGEVSGTELAAIKTKLKADFPKEKVDKYMLFLDKELKNPSKITRVCSVIDYDFDQYTKTHLFYFLVSLATADGILTDNEENCLKRIARKCGIRTSLSAVLKSFKFKREQHHYQKANSQNASSKRVRLKAAYDLIGVAENATMDEIKKAYRKLAKTHHPDKVAHLGNILQKKANETFQRIADAYELITSSRGV